MVRLTRRTVPRVVAGLVVVLLLAACSPVQPDSDAATPAGAVPLEGTDWTLTALDEGFGVPFEPAVMMVTARFDSGSVGGTSGCNQYGGDYRVEDDTITFGMMVSTLMACEEPQMLVEQAYLQALQAGPATFAIEGDTLTLTTAGGVMSFTGTPAASAASTPLTGVEWTLVSMDEIMGVTFDPSAVTVTILFAEDGTVSGSAGCNGFSGGYVDDGASLSFAPLASTQMLCPEPDMSIESAILRALQGSVPYTLEGNSLVLTTAGGVLVFEGVVASA